MSSNFSLACIGGSFAKDLLPSLLSTRDHQLPGTRLGSRKTPFGNSQPIYLCENAGGQFHLLLRHSDAQVPIASSFANHRANIYALKELGITHILSWSAARAVSHNYRVGQFALPDDLIDETRHRAGTFFEHGAILDLRQWPVFCPSLRSVLGDILLNLGLKYSETGTYLCGEGPRRETRAEVRKYALWGADLLGHSLAPEAFLAKELQMCYASICIVNDFAETGSVHRPYEAGGLFTNLPLRDHTTRGKEALVHLPAIMEHLLAALPKITSQCGCQTSLAPLIESGSLSEDFHNWFETLQPARTPAEEKKYYPIPVSPGTGAGVPKKTVTTG
jgi:5'-methylthioadenosine phosphorylase